MSWVPASTTYDPQSRSAPRPSGTVPPFTFGHLEERQAGAASSVGGSPVQQQQQQAPAGLHAPRACFDEPVEQLRWWQQPRNNATVAGTANKDVEAFWQQARQQGAGPAAAVKQLVNRDAFHTNKSQGTGSTVAASLGDREQFSLAQAQSAYKADMTASHVRVGKRGVALPPEAMQAYEESRQQAVRNKQVGKATNMKLALF